MGFGLGGEETRNKRTHKHALRLSRHLGVLPLKPKLPTILDRGLALQFATELMLEEAIRPQEQISCNNERETKPRIGRRRRRSEY